MNSPSDSPSGRPTPEGAERGDASLVQKSLAGDPSAYDVLVARYQTKIYNLAFRVTANSQDARDATQSTFLKAWQNLARFDPAHKFFSWIYRIGLNESLNLVDRRRRLVALDERTKAVGAGPERLARSRETGRAIARALDELTPDLRVTIVLRHLHGLSYAEMSEVIGVPVQRVKSRLFSARVKLRQRLTEEGLGPGRQP